MASAKPALETISEAKKDSQDFINQRSTADESSIRHLHTDPFLEIAVPVVWGAASALAFIIFLVFAYGLIHDGLWAGVATIFLFAAITILYFMRWWLVRKNALFFWSFIISVCLIQWVGFGGGLLLETMTGVGIGAIVFTFIHPWLKEDR